jgi:hypothetical protein
VPQQSLELGTSNFQISFQDSKLESSKWQASTLEGTVTISEGINKGTLLHDLICDTG